MATRSRVDTDALKRAHPILDVVSAYGIELRRSGRAYVGRCPFHADGGRPNLHAYPDSTRWVCYRCNESGDTIRFVEAIEGLDFRGAVARLSGASPPASPAPRPPARRLSRPAAPRPLEPAARACLAAAVELYRNSLLAEPDALGYLAGRGLTRATVERHRLGYAAGGQLAAYLRCRRLPLSAARRAGLLTADGREVLAGRVVIPELRAGGPVWLIGRTLAPDGSPKYLGLRGPKPLLGWESAATGPTVVLCEGPLDWLTLRQWGLPALALVGTRVRPELLATLARFRRLYAALDADDAGRAATAALREQLGGTLVPVALPDGVKDVAELALLPDGAQRFAGAVLEADRATRSD